MLVKNVSAWKKSSGSWPLEPVKENIASAKATKWNAVSRSLPVGSFGSAATCELSSLRRSDEHVLSLSRYELSRVPINKLARDHVDVW